MGAIAIILWASAWSAAIFGSMKAFKVLRVPRLVELKGECSLDVCSAYNSRLDLIMGHLRGIDEWQTPDMSTASN